MKIGFIMLGKVDEVPELFSVKTRFLMIGVPLCPMGSYLVPERGEPVPIPVSGKSVFWAYGRTGLILAGVGVLFLGLPPEVRAKFALAPVFAVLAMLSLWFVAWKSFHWTRASRERAFELAALAGVSEDVVEEHLAGKPGRRVIARA